VKQDQRGAVAVGVRGLSDRPEAAARNLGDARQAVVAEALVGVGAVGDRPGPLHADERASGSDAQREVGAAWVGRGGHNLPLFAVPMLDESLPVKWVPACWPVVKMPPVDAETA
jgi:hypothetical protein